MDTVLGVLIILAVVLVAVAVRPHKHRVRSSLHYDMRRLWFDHVDRTNLFIISTLHELPDADVVGTHLHENQDEIAAALGQVYGPAFRDRIASLLHDHIRVAGEIVVASRDGTPADALISEWYQNANEIADLLQSTNPTILAGAREMMKAHLDATTAYLTYRVQEDWANASRQHDEVITQALHMADMLAMSLE